MRYYQSIRKNRILRIDRPSYGGTGVSYCGGIPRAFWGYVAHPLGVSSRKGYGGYGGYGGYVRAARSGPGKPLPSLRSSGRRPVAAMISGATGATARPGRHPCATATAPRVTYHDGHRARARREWGDGAKGGRGSTGARDRPGPRERCRAPGGPASVYAQKLSVRG